LALLACGLGLYLLARPSAHGGATTVWVGTTVAVVLAVIGVVVVGHFLWPTMVSAVFFGCLPGLVVLTVAFAILLVMQEHQRRQIVFLPSFTRSRAGSSIIRAGSTGSNPRPQPPPSSRGEPSTVDQPSPNGSNPRPLGDVLRTEEAGGNSHRGA
jgi:hypothetical protein